MRAPSGIEDAEQNEQKELPGDDTPVEKDPETFSIFIEREYSNRELKNVIAYAYDPMSKLIIVAAFDKESDSKREFVIAMTDGVEVFRAPYAPTGVENVFDLLTGPKCQTPPPDPFAGVEELDNVG